MALAIDTGMKTSFETETCSRCNGSGSYSYCQSHGDKCFKCGGSGATFTKRGAAAKAYLDQLCTVRVQSLNVGDRVLTTGFTNGGKSYSYIATIVEISDTDDWCIASSFIGPRHKAMKVVTEHPKFGRMNHLVYGDSKFRTYPTNNAAKIEEALAYQESLTKTGKIRKGLKNG